MRERLKGLLPDSKLTIEADERSKSLLIRGPQEMMGELDRIVGQLDGFVPPTANPNSTPFMLVAPPSDQRWCGCRALERSPVERRRG
jgi:hypothetical protein